MKKILSILLVCVFMSLALVSCGGDPVVGTWNFSEVEAEKVEGLEGEDLETYKKTAEEEFKDWTITFEKDGKATVKFENEAPATWEADGEKITLSGEGDVKLELTLKDGKLIMGEEGLNVIFVKK